MCTISLPLLLDNRMRNSPCPDIGVLLLIIITAHYVNAKTASPTPTIFLGVGQTSNLNCVE